MKINNVWVVVDVDNFYSDLNNKKLMTNREHTPELSANYSNALVQL